MTVLQLENDFTASIKDHFDKKDWHYFEFNEVKKHLHTVFYASVRFVRELLYNVNKANHTSIENTLTLEKLLAYKDENSFTYHSILELDIKNYIRILIINENDKYPCSSEETQEYFNEEQRLMNLITNATIQYFIDLDTEMFD